MDLYLLRVGISNREIYPKPAHIFGIKHYLPKELGEEEFSKKLMYFYKYGNNLNFFLEKLIDLFKLRFEGDSIKFDYVTLYPTRKKDKINPNMENLIKRFSESINIPYKQIIRRNRDIRPNHELKTFEERKKNVDGSINILDDIKGKNIIVLDNTAITSISLIDATNLLLEKGAKHIACICLGLGYKGKDSDWDDLNKTLKYSRIINICKSPYVKKEIREKWKKEQQQS